MGLPLPWWERAGVRGIKAFLPGVLLYLSHVSDRGCCADGLGDGGRAGPGGAFRGPMPVRFVPLPRFNHPGNLKGFAVPDPRASEFRESSVEIDLRTCEFIEPSAVMWCLVYSLLAKRRGCDCTLLVPENMGVCSYRFRLLVVFDVLRPINCHWPVTVNSVVADVG